MHDHEEHPALNGVRQWIRVAGARRDTVPLVLLHGGPGGNHSSFEHTAGLKLEVGRTLVYWEQRGCGRSDRPASPSDFSIRLLVEDLHALVRHLGVPQVDVLGYSFGGGLALEYACARPGSVRRVVAQAPAFHLHGSGMAAHQLAGFLTVVRGEMLLRLEGILAGDATDEEKLERVWTIVDTATVDRFLFQDQRAAALNRRLWAQSGLVNTGELHRALLAQPPSDLPQHLHRIPAPVLVLVGAHDRNVSPVACGRLTARLPQGRLRVFEHSAHFPDIEETDAWAREVLSFLA